MASYQLVKTVRKRSFLDSSLRFDGIIDILNCTKEPMRFSPLVMKSRIKFKKSFLKYLRYCIEKKLVINRKVYGKRIYKPIESWFVITEKGRLFLEMVE